MRYFPIFLDLKDRLVVVVGQGEEALRKIRLLLKTEARIAVVAPALHEELAGESRIAWIARHYHAGLLDGAALVFSADATCNDTVTADARAAGIPVNAVDAPDISTFIVPSIVDRDPVVVAIGTEGTAPVLGQGLRARIDALLPRELGALARAGGNLRDRVARTLPPGNRRRSFWQRFFFGDVRDAFLAHDSCSYLSGVEGLLRDAARAPQGRVAFVGITSDDPELLTIKAQRKLIEADIIVHDAGIADAILELARRDAMRRAVPGKSFDGTDAVLVSAARSGRRVVRLVQGVPAVEETVAVAAEGIAIETIAAVAVADGADPASRFPINDHMRDALLRAAS